MAPSAAACAAAFAARLPAMRISVRPAAVTCAVMNAISTSIHSTISRAKPRCSGAGAVLGIGLDPVRIGRAAERLALQFLADEPGIDQLVAEVLGERAGVALVLDHARGDQHQQFGALTPVHLARYQAAEQRNVLEQRDPRIALRVAVADQAGEPHRLTVLDRDAGADQPLIEGRRVESAG